MSPTPPGKNPSNYHSWAFRKSTQMLRNFIRKHTTATAISKLTNTPPKTPFPKYVDRKILAARHVLEVRGASLSEQQTRD